MEISDVIQALAAPAVTGLFLFAVQRITARSQKDIARGPEWDSFAQRQQQHYVEIVSEAKEGEAQERTRRENIQRKYRLALSVLRQLMHRYPEERERLPPDVASDL